MKNIILVAAAFAIACAVAGLVLLKRPAAPDMASPIVKASRQPEPSKTVAHALPAAPQENVPSAVAEMAAPLKSDSAPQTPSPATQAAAAPRPKASVQANQGGRPAKEPLHDPLAREALAFVGADPIADEYWYAAINDPNLPAHERQDLIEDLNEDGLSDPKHPGPEDLPLIVIRMEMIRNVAATAWDQVTLDACEEVYKDLGNLAGVAIGSGQKVR
jgi:hypothetical protein